MSRGDLQAVVSSYGAAATAKFAVGGGEPEDQLRSPFEGLLAELAMAAGLPRVVASGEHRLADERIRPDYAIWVDGALVGVVEIKAPGKGADPTRFKGHDKRQWERLACMPNVLYTDGETFGLYRDGERVGDIVRLRGSVETAGSALTIDDPDQLLGLFERFLRWSPLPPSRPKQLAGVAARLCRLLRTEVGELLGSDEGLQALADDWRRLLFPSLTDGEFADAYAQTVTFGLLLARVENIDLTDDDLHDVAVSLGQQHTLVGRALDLLTDPQVLGKLAVTVTTLRRVLSVVDWQRVSKGRESAWLYFYEWFLEEYDPALRKATGSYYTPVEVVDSMVQLVDQVLRQRLGHPSGFASPGVEVVDPCTGSGTFLVRIIEQIAGVVEADEGRGAVPARMTEAARRLVGFELQAGPYSVAELRIAADYARHEAPLPPTGLRLYLSDTLSNPFEEEQNLGAQYLPIARSRRSANEVKATDRVVVVIGNPPYKERSKGKGGWIEKGAREAWQGAPLAEFMPPKEWGLGAHVKHLYNPYIYFWRWATWKVFDGNPGDRGVVAFITVAGFLNGPGFARMRDYLRRTADAIWVVDCSPEGHQPDVPTRIFQGVQQPVCIVVAVKDGSTSSTEPAVLKFTSVTGRREEKFKQLEQLSLADASWQDGAAGWKAPLLPAMQAGWASCPSLDDVLPWSGPGTTANRTWVINPSPEVLTERVEALFGAAPEDQPALLKETPSTNMTAMPPPFAGYSHKANPLNRSAPSDIETPVRIAFRSFDRQWLIPDGRLVHRPRPSLWQVRSAPGQVFVTAPQDVSPTGGPAATFTDLVPDLHHFHGRGGRVYPLWLDSGGTRPNLAPGLLDWLTTRFGWRPSADAFFAYVAAVLGSPAFVQRFSEDLVVPGLRLPLTASGELFREAADAGARLLWLQTYGERYVDASAGRPAGPPRLPDPIRPLVLSPIPHGEIGMPDSIAYDPDTQHLLVGDGVIGPVPEAVWTYEVSGMRVVKRWFDRRKKAPDGRRSTPLDDIVARQWEPAWTTELLQLLNVLSLITEMSPGMIDLLDQIMDGPLITVDDLEAASVLPIVDRPVAEQPPRGEQLFAI